MLEDPGGEPLQSLLGAPMPIGQFLPLSIAIAAALGKVHQRGLVHKDIKPANILANRARGEIWLTGFGITSRVPRERQAPEQSEIFAGTLAYMAPEQTGRMNRSIDSRSDLYSLGVTYYQILTGSLPFAAIEPTEWVHCHIARQPEPPSERLKQIPSVISAIVMKLLAKTAEHRYQSAAGVASDLRRCLAEWETRGCIDDFPLGEQDTPDQLLIPEKLYGREREIATLLGGFDRVVTTGTPELVLVSGYSGVGKSSVVNELHRALLAPRGLFASGKFDQYKRDIPYSTLAQAFQGLIRNLLAKSEAELACWRDGLLEALGANAQLMIDLVPELKLVIGDQPAVPDLPVQRARGRFQLVFRRFIGVFARPEHPLALFLDDLQWLDIATLDLLEDLLTQGDVQHLLLIGAYGENEVDAAHPLMRKLETIRQAGGEVQEVQLSPLLQDHLGQLVADSLHCEPARCAALAQLVHEKTAGNPFFVIRFLHTLSEEGLLAFDHDDARWCWDLDRIHAKGYTDNVVDLMLGKLARLPAETQEALQYLALLGNIAEVSLLAMVLGISEEHVHAALSDAFRQELVERLPGAYRFVHDHVREAAFSLIREELRAAKHLQIGRLLLARTPPERREEVIFEIVNPLNGAAALITSRVEREELAELNLIAGKRAKAAAAYASALNYLTAGAALLDDGCWERRHDLIFQLELGRAECEFLSGTPGNAEERLAALSTRAANAVERAAVACLRVDLYTTLTQYDKAVSVCIHYLRYVGIEWSPHPTEEDMRREYDRIWSQIGTRTIEELIELPPMTDPTSLATLDVLTKVLPPAQFIDARLFYLTASRAVNLSLERGNSDGSCVAYVMLGMVAGRCFGDYGVGFRFGQLGYDLVERRALTRFRARTYASFANNVIPSVKHVLVARNLLRRAFEAASESGDLTSAAYICLNLNVNFLAAGDPLAEAQREAERGLEFALKARFRHAIDILTASLALIRMLRGLTPNFGSLTDGQFDETRFERNFAKNAAFAMPEYRHWVRKLQARFFARDYAAAVDASLRAQRLLWASPAQLEVAEYHFYAALSRAAASDDASGDERRRHVEALSAHHRQLQIWAETCPENFENRAALVGAEIARIDGRVLPAEQLYEQAIRSARANGFVQNEAIAYERASGFYRARGFEEIADFYLGNARYRYLRWGADGKVRQLDHLYPRLREREPVAGAASTIRASVEHLDLGAVMSVLQAVSREIALARVIEAVMRSAIELAGAERGLLLLPDGAGQRVAAEATTVGRSVEMRIEESSLTEAAFPASVVQYVVRTRECVILDDASAEKLFSADAYIRGRHARSVLCLPLINQNKLNGVLYLENNLAPCVFTPSRTAVLQLLASQAAISVENTRLYRNLEQRESKIRRLVESNIIGIFIRKIEGPIIEANDAFLRIVGYDRADLVSGRIRWIDLTPPEWLDRDERQWMPELKAAGSVQPYEKEYLRKDGSRVPVLIGVASLDESSSEAVVFVVDLTERKRAEQALRDSEEQWRAVFEHNPTMYFMIDPAGIIVSVNPFGAEQLGYTVDELVGRPVGDLFHETDRATVGREVAACFEQAGRAMSWEVRKITKGGAIIWVRETARAMMIRQQPILLVTCEDISERKRIEHLTHQWFESSPSAVAIIGRDYRYLRVNPVFERDWGLPAGRVIGMHVRSFGGRKISSRLSRRVWTDASPEKHRGTRDGGPHPSGDATRS